MTRDQRYRSFLSFRDASAASTVESVEPSTYSLITAARPAYAGTEGCSILLVFFISFFI